MRRTHDADGWPARPPHECSDCKPTTKRATDDLMFSYLDEVRASGVVNIFDARPYLMEEFDIPPKRAKEVLIKWIRERATS